MDRRLRLRPVLWSGLLLFPVFAARPAYGLEQWDSLGVSDGTVDCVAVAPGDSTTILTGGAYLYVSTNDGLAWITKTNVPSVMVVAFGSSKSVAFAGSWGGGVFRSTDGCTTWLPHNTGLNNTVVLSICVDPTNDLTVYAATQGGLHKSTDGGLSWIPIKTGVAATAVAVSPAHPQTVFLGTGNYTVWKSDDGGSTWAVVGAGSLPAPTSLDVNAIAFDPASDSIVYAVFRFSGAWVSFDAGSTWTQINAAFEGFAVATDRLRPGFVYGLGGWTTPKRSGCYGGAGGWVGMDTGWGGWFARAIAVDPNNSSRIYACGNNFGLLRWIADITAPAAPPKATATAAGNVIQLSWSASSSSDCTGYWIYKRLEGQSYPPAPTYAVQGINTNTFSDTNVVAGTNIYYKVAAVDAGQNRSAFSPETFAQVVANYDLDVTYITRLPQDNYFYSVVYPDGLPTLQSGTENLKRWPAYGETVTFEAHFVNKGTATTPAPHYRWKVNGQVIATGTAPGVGPGQEGTATVNWQWNINGLDTDHTDQTLTFEIDYDNLIAETYEQNNSVTDFLEGMAIWISVEQPIYDAFNQRTNLVGTKSFEDWIQAQFKAMNDNFARSTYALAPRGCLERVRIDRIVVGTMPGGNNPDGRWSFTGDPSYEPSFANGVDAGLIHELTHQLGNIDLYNLPVSPPHNGVLTPDGLPCGMGFAFARAGLMGGGDIYPHSPGQTQFMPEYYSSHDVLALNSNVGYRRGYYGEYLFDLPANNYLVINDSAGHAAPGVTIKVYQGGGGQVGTTPVSSGTTDAQGKFLIPNRLPVRVTTTATGHTINANPFGTVDVVGTNSTVLIEMSRPGGDFDYRFLCITDFNQAYWGGNTANSSTTINSRLAGNSFPRITNLNAGIGASSVALVWSAIPCSMSVSLPDISSTGQMKRLGSAS